MRKWRIRKTTGKICLLACLIMPAKIVAAQKIFDNNIYCSFSENSDLRTAVNDMAFWLNKAYRQTFNIRGGSYSTDENGIFILETSPADKKNTAQFKNDGQSFHLTLSANKAVITGTGSASLINGIYTLLHELGFRWYMPGDTWAILPSTANKKPTIDKVYSPSFRNRSYSPAGGTTGIPGIDPTDSFEKDFLQWNRRNRWSADQVVKGHAGDAFYKAKKVELDKHPEYFCNGKVNRYGRIDISKPAVVDLFVDWALSQVNSNQKGRFPVIGVDPEDGSGQADDCLPTGMRGVATWSDKFYWLANQVAERLPDNSPAIVQLYAYSKYAAPPQFPLNKYVYPVIIPYSYQSYAQPETMIAEWKKKMNGRPMGIYDYWNSIMTGKGLPKFNIHEMHALLKSWEASNITTVHLESTYAKGAMGHVLWLASMMMWDLNTPFESLYNDFLQNCFGKAAPDIRRMYDRWSLSFQEGLEVDKSMKDLASAAKKTSDPAILKRINELKAYMIFIQLYYQYSFSKSVPDYETLVDYIYRIHDRRLVQTTALIRSYLEKPKNYQSGNNVLSTARRASISENDIESLSKKYVKTGRLDYSISNFVLDLKRASLSGDESMRYQPAYIDGKMFYQFYNPVEQELIFQAGASVATPLLIENNNKPVFSTEIRASEKGYQQVKVRLPAGVYTLIFGDNYRFCRLQFPEKIAFFSQSNKYNNYQYPRQYIYVPGDVSEIVYTDHYGPGFGDKGFWTDPDGKRVNPVKMRLTYYRIPVLPHQRNRVWSFNVAHGSYKMLNIQHLFSVNPFSYRR